MFSQIYLNKLINKDKYDRGELLCLSLINLDDISHAQTQLFRVANSLLSMQIYKDHGRGAWPPHFFNG